MSPVHILTLSLGRAMVKAQLLTVQPNILLVSVGVPSARSFLPARVGLRIQSGQVVGTQRGERRVWRVDLVTGCHRHLHLSRWRRRCNHR